MVTRGLLVGALVIAHLVGWHGGACAQAYEGPGRGGQGFFWLIPAASGGLDQAAGAVGAAGGSVVWWYPRALLVRLPEAGRPGLEQTCSVVPLPDLRLIAHWRHRFDPLDSSGLTVGNEGLPAGGLYLVQLVGPPQDGWLHQLEEYGAELVTFFPYAAQLVRLPPWAAADIQRLPWVRWLGRWAEELRFGPETAAWRDRDVGEVDLLVVLFNPERDPEATLGDRHAILDAGGFILGEGLFGNHEVVRVLAPSTALETLAAIANVIAVEAYHQPELEDESSSLVVNGQYTGEQGHSPPSPTYSSWLTSIGADGSGVTVGVIDDGVDTSEVHLSGRVTDILSGASAGAAGHGHHVAGIVAASCSHSADPQGYRLGAGVAPAACILNQPFLRTGWSSSGCGTATDYGCLTRQTVTTTGTNGAAGTVQNNSWGAGTASPMTYGSTEREYDQRVRDADETTASTAEPLTICFSAGNSGTAGLTRPKSAKNIITTGATDNYRPSYNSGSAPGAGNGCPTTGFHPLPSDNINMMVCFSSLGNCQDGRVKPDVVAPGGNIASARAGSDSLWGDIDTTHRWCSGTSQATPHTAGLAALITERWRSDNGGATPSPAMVKAMIINTAVEIRTTTTPSDTSVYNVTSNLPNSEEGWGRVDVERHLDPDAAQSEHRDQLAADLFTSAPATRSFSYTVCSPGEPLYATLVWTDAAGAVGANPALVNDLDLEVDWDGGTYLGNVLATTGSTGKLSVTGGTRDTLNNVENVFLPSVSAGDSVTVRVAATALNGDGVPYNGDPTDQDFALVVNNAGACQPPAAAPGSLTATASAANQVTLSWSTVSCDRYRILRSTSSGGTYTRIATDTSPPYVDSTVNGGVTYYYVVRAVNDPCCDSADSNEASVTAYGSCTDAPDFSGVDSVAPLSDTCGLLVQWSAATSNCGGCVVYNVYRTTPSGSFDFSSPYAACLTGLELADSGLSSGDRFRYVVRAEDATIGNGGSCNDGNEDANTTEGSAQVPASTLSDDVESYSTISDAVSAGWTHSAGSGSDDWQVSTTYNHTAAGSRSFASQDVASVTDKWLSTPEVELTGSSSMTFWHRFEFETGYDGGVLEVWNGTAWQDLGPSITANAYTHTLSASYGNPLGGRQAWSGSQTSFIQVTVDLSAYAGSARKVRWRMGCDSSVGDGWWAIDDIDLTGLAGCDPAPGDVQCLTARSTSNQNRLEWYNPNIADYATTRLCWSTTGYPDDPAACGASFHDEAGSGNGYDSWDHTGLVNTSTYYYTAFVRDTSGIYSPGTNVSGRPQDTGAAARVKWVFNTGASALAPPGIGSVYGVSNDRSLHSMVAGSGGGSWPGGWKPMAMNGPAQGRPPVVTFTQSPYPGGSSANDKAVFLGSQDGYIYAVHAETGQEIWSSPNPGYGMVQAAPAGIFSQYLAGAPDLILVGTRNAGQDNTFYALNLSDGSQAWSFDNGGGIGIIGGMAWVEYGSPPRVYFASRERTAGAGTLWCLQFGTTSASLCSGSWPVALGDVDGSPVVRGSRVLVGNNDGQVLAIDASSGAKVWTGDANQAFDTDDGPVKGFVWPDPQSSTMYFSTTNTVWAVTDAGTSPSLSWSTTSVTNPSVPLLLIGSSHLYIGSGDGELHQLDVSGSGSVTLQLGDPASPAAVGSPAVDVDVTPHLLYAGTESGAVYAIELPLS